MTTLQYFSLLKVGGGGKKMQIFIYGKTVFSIFHLSYLRQAETYRGYRVPVNYVFSYCHHQFLENIYIYIPYHAIVLSQLFLLDN